MADSLSRTLARFAHALDYEALPPQVVDKIKASLLHQLIIAIIGAGTGHGKAAIEFAKTEEPKPDGATILVDGSRATRSGAVFANSKLMHATNQSDSYRMLIHPGACVIPAGLASAELTRATGRDLLTALVLGYELEARIAGDFIPSTQARGFRSSPVYGTLGAAVTTGKLIGLTEDEVVASLALAATFTGGTTEGARAGGNEMMYHEPNSTRSGVTAALLARENVKGSEYALEGDAGFYNAFTGNNQGKLSYVFTGPLETSVAAVGEDLGQRWEIMHVTPKIYQTAGYNCPVIELMTQIRSSHALDPAEVEKITVDMNWLETSYPSPAFPNTQRSAPGVGSTHYFTAYTCAHGSYPPLKPRIDPGHAAAPTGPVDDQLVMALLNRVEIIGHKDRPAFAPRITIRMLGGTTYQGEFRGNELEWDLATETQRVTALFDDMEWPKHKLLGIVEAVSNLDQALRVDPLIQLCVRE
ncbi:MAG: hypothetical protein BZY80_06365 [SAR202 cluster bacterium Io17-Chloro-G2]|nr:MAG: hypothetical protein BZY80_06365 [SAR202 cluster bacterium Io17-Chloro-G2]